MVIFSDIRIIYVYGTFVFVKKEKGWVSNITPRTLVDTLK